MWRVGRTVDYDSPKHRSFKHKPSLPRAGPLQSPGTEGVVLPRGHEALLERRGDPALECFARDALLEHLRRSPGRGDQAKIYGPRETAASRATPDDSLGGSRANSARRLQDGRCHHKYAATFRRLARTCGRVHSPLDFPTRSWCAKIIAITLENAKSG